MKGPAEAYNFNHSRFSLCNLCLKFNISIARKKGSIPCIVKNQLSMPHSIY